MLLWRGTAAFPISLSDQRILHPLLNGLGLVHALLLAQDSGIDTQHRVHGIVRRIRKVADLHGAAIQIFGIGKLGLH
jgi:hypothetical protein